MQNNTIRIKDIAEKAGVSTGTVDRVIHNRGRVAPKVREKVLKIIKDLNYEPNLMARALGTNKVYHIAALIPDPAFDYYWEAPKLGIEKAEKDLKSFGIRVHQFLFNPYQVESFIEKASELSREKVDGIILSPIFYRETLPFFEKWKKQKVPFVLFNTELSEFDPLSYIGQDSYQSGMIAGKLIHYGRPDPCSILIAHIDEDISNAAHLVKKEQGFRHYFLQNKLELYNIVRAELDRSNLSSFVSNLNHILESTPDLGAIYVTTSKAFTLASYLEQRHIKHIRIIGYDLLPNNIHYLNKNAINFLINQNPFGQGYWGINQLTDHLVFKKDVPVFKYLPLDIVTKENLNYYIDDHDRKIINL